MLLGGAGNLILSCLQPPFRRLSVTRYTPQRPAERRLVAVGTAGYPLRPAQTRAGAVNAHGSYLGFWRRSAHRDRGAGCGHPAAPAPTTPLTAPPKLQEPIGVLPLLKPQHGVVGIHRRTIGKRMAAMPAPASVIPASFGAFFLISREQALTVLLNPRLFPAQLFLSSTKRVRVSRLSPDDDRSRPGPDPGRPVTV
jgi:hypothetical protein